MSNPIDEYWSLRLAEVKENLEHNNFEAFIVDTLEDAKRLVVEEIVPGANPATLSWGGSMTVVDSGIYEALKDREGVLDCYDKSLTPEEMVERRRQSLLVDLYITGTNALTEEGQLVNLDMIGNRVAAIAFGPKNVVVLVGRNKIVADFDEAVSRIKDFAAPVNAMRLNKKTPCRKTGMCHDCSSPERICNVWTITDKAFPKGRIKVVLINQDMGF